MLKTFRQHLLSAILLLSLAMSAAAVLSSLYYGACIDYAAEYNYGNSTPKQFPNLSVFINCFWDASGYLIVGRPELTTAWATIIIAVFTAVLSFVTNRQEKTARIAAEAARDSADAYVAGERARLFPAGIQFTPLNNWQKMYYESLGLPPPCIQQYKLVNIGKTPAVIKEYRHDMYIGEGTLPDTPPYSSNCILYTTEEPVTTDIPYTVFPPCVYPRELTAEEAVKIKNSALTIYFFGYIRYRDIFNQLHEKGFCFIAKGQGFYAVSHKAYVYDKRIEDSAERPAPVKS